MKLPKPIPKTVSPAALASRARAGNAAALKALVEIHRPLAEQIGAKRACADLDAGRASSIALKAFSVTFRGFTPAKGELLPYWTAEAHKAISAHYRSAKIAITDATSNEVLVPKAQAGQSQAISMLLMRFRPMAEWIARKRATESLSAEDAESMCIEAFVMTLGAFNPALGAIASYWTIKAHQAISDHFRNSLRCGRHNGGIAKAYFSELKAARETHGRRFIDSEDFAMRHGVSAKRVWGVSASGGGTVSLDQPVAAGAEGLTIADYTPAQDPTPAATLEDQSSLEFIKAKLQTLERTERVVIERYFGLNGYKTPERFKAIGDRLGVTVARVQQIFSGAISTMRQRTVRMDKPATPSITAAELEPWLLRGPRVQIRRDIRGKPGPNPAGLMLKPVAAARRRRVSAESLPSLAAA